MTTISGYEGPVREAVRRVLVEIVHILGPDADNVVVVGGLVPGMYFPDANPAHSGTIDIDLCVDHQSIDDARYASIAERLAEHGYETTDVPFEFIRTLDIDGQEHRVAVDFLAGEYGGTGRNRRHQSASGITMRKVRCGDLVHEQPEEITIEAQLPEGGIDRALIRIPARVLYLVLKAHAIKGRRKPKDSYDFVFVLQNYDGGVEKARADLDRFRGIPAVEEALDALREKFASPAHVGPVDVSHFREVAGEEAERVRRDAYERVMAFVSE